MVVDSEATQDTEAIQRAGLAPPKRRMNTWSGIAVGAACACLVIAIIGVTLGAAGRLPHSVVAALLSAFIVASITAVITGFGIAMWQSLTLNDKCLRDGQKDVQAELVAVQMKLVAVEALLEHISHVERQDGWAAYTAGYTDAMKPER